MFHRKPVERKIQRTEDGCLPEAGENGISSASEAGSAPEACRTLEELFLSWKQAQELESEISCLENTFPKSGDDVPGYELFKGSFTPDGFLGETERCRAHVLFVAKESHLLDNGTDGSRTEAAGERSDTFWLQEVLQAKEKGSYYCPEERKRRGILLSRSEKGVQTRYKNVLEWILKKLEKQARNESLTGSRTEDETAGNHGVKSGSDSWKTWSLADCAYLNLNKRGGYRDCDSRRLIGYVRYYQAYLLREIELLQPEYVVMMGDWKLGNESGEERNRVSGTRKTTGEEELLNLIRHALESDGISSEHRIFRTEHPAGRIGYEERSLREIGGIKRTDAGAD